MLVFEICLDFPYDLVQLTFNISIYSSNTVLVNTVFDYMASRSSNDNIQIYIL